VILGSEGGGFAAAFTPSSRKPETTVISTEAQRREKSPENRSVIGICGGDPIAVRLSDKTLFINIVYIRPFP